MNIFDNISVKSLKDNNDKVMNNRNLAQERIRLYQDEKIRIYKEFVEGFKDFALKNKIPYRAYKGTELFSGSFKGWQLSGGFCVDINGNYYKK